MMIRNAPYKYLVAAAFLFGLFMDLMDLTIVNVALPTLGRTFHAGNSALEWVVTGYLLSLAIWIPASGWIGDRFGTKKTFIFALTTFTLASALCGLSWNIGSLIAFRLLQGIGGGMMTPVGTAMLFRAFPPGERARASLILSLPTVIAPALGPILGGVLVDEVSWRWIFFVNLPIGVAGCIFSWLFLREHTEEQAGGFDGRGFLLAGAGLALVLYALSRGPVDGWGSAIVLASGIPGLLCLAALILVELRRRTPMLDLRLLGDRMFRNANVVGFASFASLVGVLFLLPLYLQTLRSFSAIETGLILLPQAIGAWLFAPLCGRLYPVIGPRRLLMVSLSLFAASSALLLFVGLNTSVWWIAGIMFVRGVAIVFTFIPMQAATYATISPRAIGRASSLFSTNRQVAGSFGVAVLATVLIERTSGYLSRATSGTAGLQRASEVAHARLLGFHDAFLAAVIIGLIGVAFAFMIRDEDAVATMQRHVVTVPEDAAGSVHQEAGAAQVA